MTKRTKRKNWGTPTLQVQRREIRSLQTELGRPLRKAPKTFIDAEKLIVELRRDRDYILAQRAARA